MRSGTQVQHGHINLSPEQNLNSNPAGTVLVTSAALIKDPMSQTLSLAGKKMSLDAVISGKLTSLLCCDLPGLGDGMTRCSKTLIWRHFSPLVKSTPHQNNLLSPSTDAVRYLCSRWPFVLLLSITGTLCNVPSDSWQGGNVQCFSHVTSKKKKGKKKIKTSTKGKQLSCWIYCCEQRRASGPMEDIQWCVWREQIYCIVVSI